MAKVLVTGGAGFIGSHIVDLLLAQGHTVSVVDDLSSGRRENLPKQVPLEVLDIRSKDLRSVLSSVSPEVIVHAAAQMSVRQSMEDPSFDTEVNVYGLINMLQAFHGKTPPFFVLLSTGGAIYGEQETFPAKETHPIRPESVYGLAKYVSELYLDLWKRQFSLHFAALRLANVYGPRQSPHGEAGVVAIFYERLYRGITPVINGSGAQTRDFIYVEDVARAVAEVAARRMEGVFNIGTGIETSVNELYAILRETSGVELAAEYGPAKPGEQMRSCIDATQAHEMFAWNPQFGLREGLQRTADWFRINHQ